MSKITYFIAIIFLITSVISCQSGKQKTYRVGISLPNNDLWHQAVVKELQHEALFYPDMELNIKYHRNTDDQQQINDIHSFIDQKMDLIVVSAGNASLITPIIQKAYDGGTPVISFDQKIKTEDYTAYVGGDNYAIGRDIASFIVNRLHGNGNVVEIRGRVESNTDIERHTGFTEFISQHPGIRLIAEKRADFDTKIAE